MSDKESQWESLAVKGGTLLRRKTDIASVPSNPDPSPPSLADRMQYLEEQVVRLSDESTAFMESSAVRFRNIENFVGMP